MIGLWLMVQCVLNRLKQQGLYVDWGDGQVATPVDVDTGTAQAIAELLASLRSKSSTSQHSLKATARRLKHSLLTSRLPEEDAEALAGKTIDEVVAFLHQPLQQAENEGQENM